MKQDHYIAELQVCDYVDQIVIQLKIFIMMLYLDLQKNNAKVGEELAHKTFEIGNQQKTFTSELEEVKKGNALSVEEKSVVYRQTFLLPLYIEVALATERIEVMRQQLSGVETENSLLRTKLQQKDIEILHLNDLNKYVTIFHVCGDTEVSSLLLTSDFFVAICMKCLHKIATTSQNSPKTDKIQTKFQTLETLFFLSS